MCGTVGASRCEPTGTGCGPYQRRRVVQTRDTYSNSVLSISHHDIGIGGFGVCVNISRYSPNSSSTSRYRIGFDRATSGSDFPARSRGRFAEVASHCQRFRKNNDSPTSSNRYMGSRDDVRERDWFNCRRSTSSIANGQRSDLKRNDHREFMAYANSIH